MSESDNLQKLGESLRSVMGSPEFENILKSFGVGNTSSENTSPTDGTDAVTGFAQNAFSADGAAQNKLFSGVPAQNAGVSDGAEGTVGAVPATVSTVSGAGSGINIPPELIKNLPSVISALSGMGLDGATLAGMMSGIGTDSSQSPGSTAVPVSAAAVGDKDKQRRALLGAIRPYLGDSRQRIVDSMLQLEKLTGLLGTFSGFNPGNK